MKSFRWLHLTDLHCGMPEQKALWPNLETEFFADLARLHDRCGPWDVIFFTGDLVQSGQKLEFERLSKVLGRLYGKLGDLGSKPVLLTVPGNHDLVRPPETDSKVVVLSTWSQQPKIQDE